MNALRAPLSSAAIGWSRPALAASVALHVAAALPLFLPMARPEAEVMPPVAVELVMAAADPVAAAPPAAVSPPAPTAPAPLAASPRATMTRAQSVPRAPAAKPVAAPPITAASDSAVAPQAPAETGTADPADATVGTGHRGAESASGGGTTGREAGGSPPGYSLGAAHTPAPDYPWSARRRGIEGRVVLRLDVGADGIPTGVDLVHGSGNDALDQAAITTVWHWRLRPAMAGGVAVAGRVVVPIVFKLT